MNEESLEGVAAEASQDGQSEQEQMEVEHGNVKLSFEAATDWLDEAPKLGEDVEFRLRGYVRRKGVEHLMDSGQREFVVVRVVGIERIDRP